MDEWDLPKLNEIRKQINLIFEDLGRELGIPNYSYDLYKSGEKYSNRKAQIDDMIEEYFKDETKNPIFTKRIKDIDRILHSSNKITLKKDGNNETLGSKYIIGTHKDAFFKLADKVSEKYDGEVIEQPKDDKPQSVDEIVELKKNIREKYDDIFKKIGDSLKIANLTFEKYQVMTTDSNVKDKNIEKVAQIEEAINKISSIKGLPSKINIINKKIETFNGKSDKKLNKIKDNDAAAFINLGASLYGKEPIVKKTEDKKEKKNKEEKAKEKGLVAKYLSFINGKPGTSFAYGCGAILGGLAPAIMGATLLQGTLIGMLCMTGGLGVVGVGAIGFVAPVVVNSVKKIGKSLMKKFKKEKEAEANVSHLEVPKEENQKGKNREEDVTQKGKNSEEKESKTSQEKLSDIETELSDLETKQTGLGTSSLSEKEISSKFLEYERKIKTLKIKKFITLTERIYSLNKQIEINKDNNEKVNNILEGRQKEYENKLNSLLSDEADKKMIIDFLKSFKVFKQLKEEERGIDIASKYVQNINEEAVKAFAKYNEDKQSYNILLGEAKRTNNNEKITEYEEKIQKIESNLREKRKEAFDISNALTIRQKNVSSYRSYISRSCNDDMLNIIKNTNLDFMEKVMKMYPELKNNLDLTSEFAVPSIPDYVQPTEFKKMTQAEIDNLGKDQSGKFIPLSEMGKRR